MVADASLSFVNSASCVCKNWHKCKWGHFTTKPLLYICFHVQKQTSSEVRPQRKSKKFHCVAFTLEKQYSSVSQAIFKERVREFQLSCRVSEVKEGKKKSWTLQLVDVDTKSSLWCKWECHFTPLWPLNGDKFRTGQKQPRGMSVHLGKKPPVTVSPVHLEQFPDP